MKQIPVWSKGEIVGLALVDDEDYEKYSTMKWQMHNHGYATRTVGPKGKQKRIYLHREVLNARGSGRSVDHINRNGLDCRKENLRLLPQGWNGWANIQRMESRLRSTPLVNFG